jgi:hypothetical protein
LARWRHPTRLRGPEGQLAASRGAIIAKFTEKQKTTFGFLFFCGAAP